MKSLGTLGNMSKGYDITGDEDGVLEYRKMATFGEFREFAPETEKIPVYLERADLYFKANSVKDDKKAPIFLSMVGTHTYHLLRDIFCQDKLQDKSLA